MIRALLAAMLVAAAGPAAGQDRDAPFRIGDDMFRAGTSVVHDTEGVDDLFAAAEMGEIAAPLTGSAYLAGRRVAVGAEVGGDLHAAGADVTVSAPVAGDATLGGYDVTVAAPVSADLRAAARNLRLSADVGGTALVAAESVDLDAAIAGDAEIAADSVTFGDGASVGGRLVLVGEQGRLAEVPPSVAPPERVEHREIAAGHAPAPDRPRGWLALASGMLGTVLVVTALATLAAVVAPHGVERLRAIADERPFRTFWIGFLALATLLGASILLVLTLIGVFVAPAVLVAAFVLAVLGYVLAVYLTGRAVWSWIGQLPPDSFWERALTALIGAVLVALIALVPFVGWLAVLVLTLTGLGALTVAVLRPEFRA
jgi:hypothetical protein